MPPHNIPRRRLWANGRRERPVAKHTMFCVARVRYSMAIWQKIFLNFLVVVSRVSCRLGSCILLHAQPEQMCTDGTCCMYPDRTHGVAHPSAAICRNRPRPLQSVQSCRPPHARPWPLHAPHSAVRRRASRRGHPSRQPQTLAGRGFRSARLRRTRLIRGVGASSHAEPVARQKKWRSHEIAKYSVV